MPVLAPAPTGKKRLTPLTLPALRGVAALVAAEEGGTLDLLGTIAAEGSADYVEVIFGERASDSPRKLVVTVKRRMTEIELGQTLRRGLRAHLQKTA